MIVPWGIGGEREREKTSETLVKQPLMFNGGLVNRWGLRRGRGWGLCGFLTNKLDSSRNFLETSFLFGFHGPVYYFNYYYIIGYFVCSLILAH